MLINQLVKNNMLSKEMADYISFTVKEKANILVTGKISSGKTTLVKALFDFMPAFKHKVAVVEELQGEMRTKHDMKNFIFLNKNNDVCILDQISSCRPKFVIIDGISTIMNSDEIIGVLDFMETSDSGVIITNHVPFGEFTIRDFIDLTLTTKSREEAVEQVYRAIDIVVHIERDNNGYRYINYIGRLKKDEFFTDLIIEKLWNFNNETKTWDSSAELNIKERVFLGYDSNNQEGFFTENIQS